MKNIKGQIKALSSQAAQLSLEATAAFRQRNFAQGKRLMAQAAAASKDCQRLIQEYKAQVGTK